MNENGNSAISFKSNIQPVYEKTIANDYRFLSYIRDPFALTELEKKIRSGETKYQYTEIQKNEYGFASLHCAYAPKEDYPWGTIIENEQEQIACKCLNEKCHHFSSCRPDFNKNELKILLENKTIKKQMEIKAANKRVQTVKDGGDIDVGKNNLKGLYDRKDKKSRRPNSERKLTTDTEVVIDLLDDDINNSNLREVATNQKKTEDKPIVKCNYDSFVVASQEEFIKADVVQRTIINAGPGTGKTWALIEKLIFMVVSNEIDAESIMVLCFSRAAVGVIEERLREAANAGRIGIDWHQIEIRTFDSFATYMIAWVMENHSELLQNTYCLGAQSYDDRIQTATILLEKKKNMFEQYHHIIVDEVQDLVGCRAELVLQILKILPESCGFSLLGDACQAIYDFQVGKDNSVMGSDAFYKHIFKEYKSAAYWKFTVCHRQQSDFPIMTEPYRNAILKAEKENLLECVRRIKETLPTAAIDIRRPTAEKIEDLKKGDTLGILTRSNGQALKISTWLKNEGIPHVLQKPAEMTGYADWIGHIFTQYEYDTINKDLFMEAFLKVYPISQELFGIECWNALTSAQRSVKSRYQTSELLSGIIENNRNNRLTSAQKQNADITVSNIYRVKGQEFDTVLLTDNIVDSLEEYNAENIIEHKVCYVGITRPKKQIYGLKMAEWIKIGKDAHKRCYQTGWPKKGKKSSYITNIEIGKPNDIDSNFFAGSKNIQKYIRENIKPGIPLALKKKDKSDGQGYYDIILDDEKDNLVLGETTEVFKQGLECILRNIYQLPEFIEPYDYLYPNMFTDLYVDDLVTCISKNTGDKPGAKIFDDICIWNGFTVSGFAVKVNDRY